MSNPKRHHWWPQLQSGDWVGDDGNIFVISSNGSFFKSTPKNIGVEGELYTRFEPNTGGPNREIENWLANAVDGPFVPVLRALSDSRRIQREPAGPRGSDAHLRELESLGWIFRPYSEVFRLSKEEHAALVRYLAAAIVRHPQYLRKVTEFHQRETDFSNLELETKKALTSATLDNMLHLYELYAEAIAQSTLILTIAEGKKEFLFSDAGVYVSEPWKKGPCPFDAIAPMTPKVAINVLTHTSSLGPMMIVARCGGAIVSRYNRSLLSKSERFVFSRSYPPLGFITKNFGKPAPEPFASRFVDGKLETKYDKSRDF